MSSTLLIIIAEARRRFVLVDARCLKIMREFAIGGVDRRFEGAGVKLGQADLRNYISAPGASGLWRMFFAFFRWLLLLLLVRRFETYSWWRGVGLEGRMFDILDARMV